MEVFSSWLTEPEIPGRGRSGLPSAHGGAAHNKGWCARGGREGGRDERNVAEEKIGTGLAVPSLASVTRRSKRFTDLVVGS